MAQIIFDVQVDSGELLKTASFAKSVRADLLEELSAHVLRSPGLTHGLEVGELSKLGDKLIELRSLDILRVFDTVCIKHLIPSLKTSVRPHKLVVE